MISQNAPLPQGNDQTTHSLKCPPEFFQAILLEREKTFELREDGRGYKVGDLLLLREWEREYTGREILVLVRYILKDCLFAGLRPGFVIMSIDIVRRA